MNDKCLGKTLGYVRYSGYDTPEEEAEYPRRWVRCGATVIQFPLRTCCRRRGRGAERERGYLPSW